MSDDTTRAILAAVQSGDMTPGIAADLLAKTSGGSAAAQPAAQQQAAAPEQPAKSPDQVAAEQFLAEVQAAQSKHVSIPVQSWGQ